MTSNADVVTASGEVRMTREGYNLRADSVIWNRTSGEVRAEGSVRVVSPGGDVAYGDSVVLEDTLRDGVVENCCSCWRMAAGWRRSGPSGDNGVTTLYRAAYTACAVVDDRRLPEGADLADQRGPRRPRSGPPPHPLSGRDA